MHLYIQNNATPATTIEGSAADYIPPAASLEGGYRSDCNFLSGTITRGAGQ